MDSSSNAGSSTAPGREPGDTPRAFRAGLAGSFRFEDFDEFAAGSPHWEQRIKQLGRGRPSARLVFAQTASVQVALVRRDPGVCIEGTGPRGAATFVLPLAGSIRIQGERCRPEDVVYVAPGAPFEFHGPGTHVVLVASLDQALFDRIACIREVGLPARPACTWPVFADRASRQRFVNTCARWIGSAHRDPTWLQDAGRAQVLEDAVASSLLGSVRGTVAGRRTPSSSKRIVGRAEEIMRARLDQPLAVWQIAEGLGVPLRTFHESFLSCYGMTPKAYLSALRLDAARRDLRKAEPGTRVIDVAFRWCFFHLGRFSGAYQRAFGETPSETLRRSRGRWAGMTAAPKAGSTG